MGAIDLTLGACLEAEAALARIAAAAWPIRTAYHMAKLLRLMRVETKAFDEQRIALIKTLGSARPSTTEERARGSDAEVFEVAPDRMPEYMRQMRELRDLPITIAWAPLTLDELGAADQRVSAVDLADLGAVLADSEPAVKEGT